MSQATGKTIDLRPYLEDLERRICPEEETRLEQEWVQFADGNCRQEVFVPRRKITSEEIYTRFFFFLILDYSFSLVIHLFLIWNDSKFVMITNLVLLLFCILFNPLKLKRYLYNILTYYGIGS